MFEARVEAIERWRGGDRERMRGVRTHNLQHINVRRGVLRKFLSQLGEPRTDNERRMVESVNQELEQYQREEERMTNNPDSYLPGMI